MTFPKFTPAWLLFILALVSPSYADQPISGSFNSALAFSGSQWQVKASIGPVYLARKEAGVLKVLAVFDGTNGKYFLDWENPTDGEYVALDGIGARSEPIIVCDDKSRSNRSLAASSTRTYVRPSNTVVAPSAFHRNALAMASNP